MSIPAAPLLTEGQQEAVGALRSIARVSEGALTIDLSYERQDIYLIVRIYLASASLLSSEQGIELDDWEPIDLLIPEDFPYQPPIAWAGRDDFPELPHQARGSGFCVRVEDSNWDPMAGMPGFVRAVIETYQHIALGTLQGNLQPWRPLNHVYHGQGCAVIRADLAAADRSGAETSLRWAAGIPVGENRIDIIEWLDIDDGGSTAADVTRALAGELTRISAKAPAAFIIPAVVTPKPIAIEYSDFWISLLDRLAEQGVDISRFINHLARSVAISSPRSEGHERAAVAFRLAADTGVAATGQAARFAMARLTEADVGLLRSMCIAEDEADSSGRKLEEFCEAPVAWVQVYDGRPESVLRRTAGRPTEKLAGAKILLLGCGGLGAPIAEHCVRSGAARLHIVDSGTVSPGILSRQPYEDADIGRYKAEVLADRLGRIRPGNEVIASVAEILPSDLSGGFDLDQYDLIIDATANRSVAAMIERAQRDQRDLWPTLVTVAISQQATHGVAAVTPRGTVGAGIDLLRRLGLKTCMSTALGDVYAAFFSPPAEGLNFRPDTSCSATTFIGSTTDIGALAAQLLDSALARLDPQFGAIGASPPHRSLSIVRLGSDDDLRAARVVLDLPPDRLVMNHRQACEVRVDETAMETIREYARASLNRRAPGDGHTGGLLLGQFDTVCRVAWVSQATGLPRCSTASPLRMELNTDEVRDFLDERSRRSGGMLTLIGFWHTHPGGSAEPSKTDRDTMQKLVASPEWPAAPALLLVLGIPKDGSTDEPGPQFPLEIHAETFTT